MKYFLLSGILYYNLVVENDNASNAFRTQIEGYSGKFDFKQKLEFFHVHVYLNFPAALHKWEPLLSLILNPTFGAWNFAKKRFSDATLVDELEKNACFSFSALLKKRFSTCPLSTVVI